MGATGPSLEPLRRKMMALSSQGFRREMFENLAEEGRKQMVDGFSRAVSPYGDAWPSLKHRSGSPLMNTGRLRNSITFRPTSNGIRASSSLAYAGIHLYGGRAGRGRKVGIPRRQYLPSAARGLGQWQLPFTRAVNAMVRQVMR